MVQQTRWTLDSLRTRRDDILDIARRNGAFDVRVFGSVARGEPTAESDVDFLVTFETGASILNQVSLWLDLQDFLDCRVDLLTDHPEAGAVTDNARAEAVRL